MLTRITSRSVLSFFGPSVQNLKFQRFNHSVPKASTCEGLDIEPKEGVLWMKFNRPKKYNAITRDMYVCITDTLNEVNKDDSIKAVVLTGTGEYYSSGNDLSNLQLAIADEGGPKVGLKKSSEILYNFVNSFINLKKLLIAAVNGPAVGIPVTTLPLFDYVISSDKATFQSPFTSLGQCPEACSSLTFPQQMGNSRATEMLLLNMKWGAQKAQSYGLVSEVVEHEKFQLALEELLYGQKGIIKNCYPNSLRISKSLMRSSQKEQLIEVNRQECEAILGCWLSEESADAIQKFFDRSKK